MKEDEKTCGTCAHAYYDPAGTGTQNCSSTNYNSQSYTHVPNGLIEAYGQSKAPLPLQRSFNVFSGRINHL